MIAAEPQTRHTAAVPDWQRQLAEAIRDPVELLALLELTPAGARARRHRRKPRRGRRGFPLRVPRAFIARMRRGDPRDPLLLQVLAQPASWNQRRATSPIRWRKPTRAMRRACCASTPGRALLIATGACAVHCRYCFRRHYDYGAEQDTDGPRWHAALAAVAADPIHRGGDPVRRRSAVAGQRAAGAAVRAHRCHAAGTARAHPYTHSRSCCRRGWMPAWLRCWRHGASAWSSSCTPTIRPRLDAATSDALRQLAGCSTALLNQSGAAGGRERRRGYAGRTVAAAVRRRRSALLPAPAGPGGRRGAFCGDG